MPHYHSNGLEAVYICGGEVEHKYGMNSSIGITFKTSIPPDTDATRAAKLIMPILGSVLLISPEAPTRRLSEAS